MDTKINQFDKTNLRALRVDLQNALDIIGAKYGIAMKAGNASYQANSANWKLELATIGENGAVASPERESFLASAVFYGLEKEDLDKTFTHAGTEYRIIGLLRRSRRCPILVERTGDKRKMKFPISTIKLSLGRPLTAYDAAV